MSAQVAVELISSRRFTLSRPGSAERIYKIVGTDDENVAHDTLAGVLANVYQGFVLDEVDLEPEYVDSATASGIWIGTAKYRTLDNFNEFTFDTGGGTQHVTQSIQTISSFPLAGTTAPDFKGAIGVSEDSVDGCDIVVPNYEFTETHRLPDAVVSDSYKVGLAGLTGQVNADTFRGIARGSCLFMGASGTKRGDENWSITYRFACSPALTGVKVGDITGVTKEGWQYLWIRYADFGDKSAFALVKRPVAAYVEKVYEYGDFTALGIG